MRFALLGIALVLGACSPSNPTAGEDGAEVRRSAAAPACASPLFRSIHAAAIKVADKGSVPLALMTVASSIARPEAAVGEEIVWPRIADEIANAEYEVSLQTYSLTTDSEPYKHVLRGLERLAQRRQQAGAKEPVVVRMLVSTSTVAAGSSGLPTTIMPALAASLDGLHIDPVLVRFELGAFMHVGLGSLHSKTVVIDGRSAAVMSGNLGKAAERNGAFFFEGPVARSILAELDQGWSESYLWTCGADRFKGLTDCSLQNALPEHRLPAVEGPSGCRPMLVATRKASANPFSNDTKNPQDQAFLAAMANAKERIRVITPNLNDDAAKAGLVGAMKRGVDVEIVLAKEYEEFTESLPGQGGTNLPNVKKVLEQLRAAGVASPCDRFKLRWYSSDCKVPLSGNVPGAEHLKYMSVDGQVAIVGSANMDTQSWNKEREINVAVDDAATTKAWDDGVFAKDFDSGIPACPQ